MTLAELADWRKVHPDDPMYQCANIGGKVHLVNHCGLRNFATACGLKRSTLQQVLAFLLPAHMVTCAQCSKTLSEGK